LDLRGYQKEAIQAIRTRYQQGAHRQLLVLPTGTGKTVVFAELARQLDRPTLILAHREELLTQAREKFEIIWPGVRIGTVMAEVNELDADVVVASVPTLSRPQRLNQVPVGRFGLVVVDEAHHVMAPTYRAIVDYLGLMADEPPGKALLLGVTATPMRHDKQGLARVFQEVVFERSIREMVQSGHLANLKGVRVTTSVDLSGVKSADGDFVEQDLAAVINTDNRNQLIVQAYQEKAAGRKALAFTASVAHAKDLADAFMVAGIPAAAVYGEMPEADRREVLQAFRRGEIQVVTNKNVLTEGYDEPSVTCLLMARPTQSSGLYLQMLGRGTRLFFGKQDCLVLDVADIHSRHRHALDLRVAFELSEEAEEKHRAGELDIREALAEFAVRGKQIRLEDFNPFADSAYVWHQFDYGYALQVDGGREAVARYLFIVPDLAETDRWHALCFTPPRDVYFITERTVDAQWAKGLAESHALQYYGDYLRSLAARDLGWRDKEASPAQYQILRDRGLLKFPGEHVLRGDAGDRITRSNAQRVFERLLAGFAGSA
jgi:superfamily II DNA or RNA helicase